MSLAAADRGPEGQHGIPHAVSCRALGVSQAWFYKWRRGDGRCAATPGRAGRADRYLFAHHHGSYGSPRITADLRDLGWRVVENTVAALMAEQQLVARPKRRRRSMTRPDRSARKAPERWAATSAPPRAEPALVW